MSGLPPYVTRVPAIGKKVICSANKNILMEILNHLHLWETIAGSPTPVKDDLSKEYTSFRYVS
jgi:hypothetical protein